MIDTSSIPPSDYETYFHHQNGNTQDIINVVLEADKENNKAFCDFAQQFERSEKGLKKLWSFVRHKIKYQTDPIGEQYIKCPAALWKVRQGDCKSKTIFINQVLKCLNIGYIIRFTGYGNGDYTHVYSIAQLNGKRIILDSVYSRFNKEENYSKKKDYNMTKIATIRGGYEQGRINDLAAQYMEDAKKEMIAVQQKKAYIQPAAPISYPKHTEGTALLNLLLHKLQVLGVMQENEALAQQGKNLVHNALKTGKMATGVIDDALMPIAERINKYLGMNTPATGHGVVADYSRFLRAKAKGCSIGAFPERKCFNKHWFEGNGGAGTTASPFAYKRISNGQNVNDVIQCGNFGLQYIDSRETNEWFYYGKGTKYRTSLDNSNADYNAILASVESDFPNTITKHGKWDYTFQNSSVYDAMLEELQNNMPVISNWLNDTYRADNTVNNSLGSGLYYAFAEQINSINGVNINDFPNIVVTKMLLQQQYILSTESFSTVSKNIIYDLVETGFMFDTGGKDPLFTLKVQLQEYNPSIGCGGACIAGIAAAVAAIVGAILSYAEKANQAKVEAKKIELEREKIANFNTQGTNTMPGANDFSPLVQTGNGGGNGSNGNSGNGNSGKSSALPILLMGVAGYVLTRPEE